MNNNAWQDEDIARVLADFEPQPSEQFRQRMQVQPWMEEPMTTPTHVAPKSRQIRRLIPLLGLLATLLIAGVVFATPPLRAVAHDIFKFIPRESTNVLSREEIDAQDQNLFETVERDLTVMEAEMLAGFAVWLPRDLPQEYQHRQVWYVPAASMVALTYSVDGDQVLPHDELPWLSFMQLPADEAAKLNMFKVGLTAAIEPVQIGDVQGEYVSGSWMGHEGSAYWVGDDSNRSLYWRQGDQIFVLNASGNHKLLSREQMIDIAASMAPGED